MDYLEKINQHPRDLHITFEEGPHIYTIDGDSNYMSVTTWNHSHFEHFDPDIIINNMMKSNKWKQNKYYGMTVQQIKDLWDKNRDTAATAGTKLHYDIECFYNNNPQDNNSIEYQYFIQFSENNSHLVPYRTEWMIWNKELKLAGSIDMVFENSDGTLQIYDWKRCKEIKKNPSWNKYAITECINHIPDTNFWHYSLQLNTYKAMLELEYDKIVTDMYLVCLHPDNNSYQVFKVPDLSSEISELFNFRKSTM